MPRALAALAAANAATAAPPGAVCIAAARSRIATAASSLGSAAAASRMRMAAGGMRVRLRQQRERKAHSRVGSVAHVDAVLCRQSIAGGHELAQRRQRPGLQGRGEGQCPLGKSIPRVERSDGRAREEGTAPIAAGAAGQGRVGVGSEQSLSVLKSTKKVSK